jgi:hypothetical protein
LFAKTILLLDLSPKSAGENPLPSKAPILPS